MIDTYLICLACAGWFTNADITAVDNLQKGDADEWAERIQTGAESLTPVFVEDLDIESEIDCECCGNSLLFQKAWLCLDS